MPSFIIVLALSLIIPAHQLWADPCGEALDDVPSFMAPTLNGFAYVSSQKWSPSGAIARVTYQQPRGGLRMNNSFFVGSLFQALKNFRFYDQFGYSFTGPEIEDMDFISRKNQPLSYFGQPNAEALNAVSDYLAQNSEAYAPAFRFVPYPFVLRDNVAISNHFSRKEILIYEKSLYPTSTQDEQYFYHDRNVHGLFWLVAGPDIADAIATRHQLLADLYQILSGSPAQREIKIVMNFENKLADLESAQIDFSEIRKSVNKAIADSAETEDSLFKLSDYERPDVRQLLWLYLLTRSGRSIIKYDSDDEILLKTYDSVTNYRSWSVNIAHSLNLQQRSAIKNLYHKAQDIPEIPLQRLDQVRLGILQRLSKPEFGGGGEVEHTKPF